MFVAQPPFQDTSRRCGIQVARQSKRYAHQRPIGVLCPYERQRQEGGMRF